jgi:uncharacterized membrane protein
MRAVERARRPVSLLLIVACLGGTLVLSAAIKAPCASGDWGDGRQYRAFCYSDIVPLLATEQLAGGRLPFLQPCAETAGNCDEYPVLTMYFMRVAAWMSVGDGAGWFFATNAFLLAICAVAIAVCLSVMGGTVLRFVLAPTLAIYAFMNWDLLAVALATGALLAFFRRRDGWAGTLLGLGAAAKLYPALLLVPLIASRIRQRDPDAAIRLGWAATGTWLAVNLPFALIHPSSWWTFFRFNGERPADWDSLWYLGCQHVSLDALCRHTGRINLASAVVFVAGFALAWRMKAHRDPTFPRWTLGLPLLVLFLLTNKVYSPQYGLWLLPWFALGGASLRAYLAFEAADVAVFITRFSFFGELSGFGGLSFGWFEIAIWIRAAILVWIVVSWVRRREADALPEAVPREVAVAPPSATPAAPAPA